jgi:hypothetical protein
VLPCPPGTFGGAPGLASAACSGPCTAPPGSACGWNATTPAGARCPPFAFCPGGAALPVPCACPGACAGGGLAADPTAGAPCAKVCAARALAGTGASASTDGPALAGAAFAKPRSLALAPDGATIWMTEDNDGTAFAKVRQLTPGGVVSTIAGAGAGYAEGLGTAALFNRPLSIAIDPAVGVARPPPHGAG